MAVSNTPNKDRDLFQIILKGLGEEAKAATKKLLETKEALEILIRLQALNLISNEHIDIMLEKASFLGFHKINADMIKQYIAIFLFEAPEFGSTGSRTLLNYYDTIN